MFRLSALMLAVVLLPGPASGQPSPENNAPEILVELVYRVKQQGGGLGTYVDEAAVFNRAGQGAAAVWVVEHRRRDERMGRVFYRYDWIDGRNCPALEGVIAALAKLPPAALAGLDTAPRGWISDRPEVTVMGPPAGGRIGDLLVRRDLAGPVSQWWQDAAKPLETCWQGANAPCRWRL